MTADLFEAETLSFCNIIRVINRSKPTSTTEQEPVKVIVKDSETAGETDSQLEGLEASSGPASSQVHPRSALSSRDGYSCFA